MLTALTPRPDYQEVSRLVDELLSLARTQRSFIPCETALGILENAKSQISIDFLYFRVLLTIAILEPTVERTSLRIEQIMEIASLSHTASVAAFDALEAEIFRGIPEDRLPLFLGLLARVCSLLGTAANAPLPVRSSSAKAPSVSVSPSAISVVPEEEAASPVPSAERPEQSVEAAVVPATETREEAAERLQRWWRGFLGERRRKCETAGNLAVAGLRSYMARELLSLFERRRAKLRERAARKIQIWYCYMKFRELEKFSVRVQAIVRGWIVRRRNKQGQVVLRKIVYEEGVLRIKEIRLRTECY